ncbi:MAG: hypothetical protein ACR2PL_07235, partial [Dehalococcoidia bacterium]
TTCVVFTNWSRFFQGNAPAGSTFAAETHFHYGRTDGARGAGMYVSVNHDAGASWVNPQEVNVDGRRSGNDAAMVARCKTALAHSTNSFFTTSPGQQCAASLAFVHDHRANNLAECDTEIGAKLDTESAQDANTRLLRHEQYHLNLGCSLAAMGNRLIDQGGDAATIRTQVGAADRLLQRQYDSQTGHGCNAGAQSTWEQMIDGRTLQFP